MDKSELIKGAKQIIENEGVCYHQDSKRYISCQKCPLYFKNKGVCPIDHDVSKKDSSSKIFKATKAWLAENDPPPTPFKDMQEAVIKAASALIESGSMQSLKKAVNHLHSAMTQPTDPIKKGRWLQYADKWYYLVDVATHTDNVSPEGSAYVLYKGHRYCLPEHVEITDALACSRVQFGPVWLSVADTMDSPAIGMFGRLCGVERGEFSIFDTKRVTSWKHARLVTPEEIAAAGIKEES